MLTGDTYSTVCLYESTIGTGCVLDVLNVRISCTLYIVHIYAVDTMHLCYVCIYIIICMCMYVYRVWIQ